MRILISALLLLLCATTFGQTATKPPSLTETQENKVHLVQYISTMCQLQGDAWTCELGDRPAVVVLFQQYTIRVEQLMKGKLAGKLTADNAKMINELVEILPKSIEKSGDRSEENLLRANMFSQMLGYKITNLLWSILH